MMDLLFFMKGKIQSSKGISPPPNYFSSANHIYLIFSRVAVTDRKFLTAMLHKDPTYFVLQNINNTTVKGQEKERLQNANTQGHSAEKSVIKQ